MEIEIWHIWIIVALIFFIIEIFAPTFFAASIAIGCITAGIFSYIDFGLKMQLIAFSIGTLGSFFGVRPFMLKYAHRNSDKVKTNVEALIGKIGKVEIPINNSQNQGRIIVEGEDWKAVTENNEILNAGEKVEVLKINSTTLIVKPITKK